MGELVNYNQIEFGSYIQSFRKKVGFKTAKDLANYIGVSQAIVSGWESGNKFPSYANCVILSRLFEISLDDLFATNREKMIEKHNTLIDFLNNKKGYSDDFSKLSFETQKNIIIDLIRYLKNYKSILDKVLNGKMVDSKEEKEYEEAASVLKCYMNFWVDMKSNESRNSVGYDYYVVEKISNDFNMEEVVSIEDISGEKDFVDDPLPLCQKILDEGIPSEEVELFKFKHQPKRFKNEVSLNYDYVIWSEYIITDVNGNKARRFKTSLLDSDNYKTVKKILNLKKIFDEFSFSFSLQEYLDCFFINPFNIDWTQNGQESLNMITKTILFGDHTDLLDSYLKGLFKKEKNSLFEQYLRKCKADKISPTVNVLYSFLDNEAIFVDADKTLVLSRLVLKSFKNRKEYVNLTELDKLGI